MSFAAEIKDFINSATAVRKMVDSHDSTVGKNDYYKAMIGVRQDALKQKNAHDSLMAGLRARAIGNTAGYRARRLQQIDQMNQWRMNGGGKNGAPPLVDDNGKPVSWDQFGVDGTSTASAVPSLPTEIAGPAYDDSEDDGYESGGMVRARPAGAVPVPPPQMSALPIGGDPGKPDPRGLNTDFMPGKGGIPMPGAPAPELAPRGNFSSFNTDPPRPGLFLARGGMVEETPPAQDFGSEPPAPEQQPPQQAIPLDAPPAQAPPAREGGSTKNDSGFDMSEVLKRWGLDDKNPMPEKVTTRGNQMDEVSAARRVENPVKLGLDAITTRPPEQQAALPVNGQNHVVQRLAQNEGAYTDQEFEAAADAIDPTHQLSKSARFMSVLDSSVNFYLSKGDAKSAQKIAQAAVMYGKAKTQQLGMLARVALDHGDVPRALKYFSAASDYVPDGHKFEATQGKDGKINVALVDEVSGKKQDLGPVDPKLLPAFAASMSSGQEYLNRMMSIATGGKSEQRAAERREARTAAAAKDATAERRHQESMANRLEVEKMRDDARMNAPLKPSDLDTAGANIRAAIPADVPEEFKSKIQAPATRIFASPENRKQNLTVEEAAQGTARILSRNPDDQFSTQEAKGGVQVKFKDGMQMFVPEAQFEQLRLLRQKVKASADTAGADKGIVSRGAHAIASGIGAVGNYARGAYDAYQRGQAEHPPLMQSADEQQRTVQQARRALGVR